jgi:hypothetical protein
MATGFGLKPVRHKNGSPYNGECNMYFIPSTDASAIGIGEAMKRVAAMDTPGEVSVVAQAAAGDALIGAVVGIVPNASIADDKVYRPASVGCYVMIADDPDLIFQVQEDAVGGAVSAANIGEGYNADIVVASTTANVLTSTGDSKTMLDSSDAKAATAQLKIIGVKRDKVNSAALTAGSVLEVMIFEHALRVADSVT